MPFSACSRFCRGVQLFHRFRRHASTAETRHCCRFSAAFWRFSNGLPLDATRVFYADAGSVFMPQSTDGSLLYQHSARPSFSLSPTTSLMPSTEPLIFLLIIFLVFYHVKIAMLHMARPDG